MLLRGDFPAFYSAAQLISSGEYQNLYQVSAQSELQQQAWLSLSDEFYYFAYPPYVALLLSPLAALSPVAAKLSFSFLMTLAFLASVYIAQKRYFPEMSPLLVGASMFCFSPLFVSIAAGQNTALSLLLLLGSTALLENPTKKNSFYAGLLTGLWAFKPHFALVAFILLLRRGRWFYGVGAGLVLALYYLLAAQFFSFSWPLEWFQAVSEFSAEEAKQNAFQMVSLYALLKHAYSAELSMLLALIVLSVPMLLLSSKLSGDEFLRTSLFIPILVLLIGPHAVFYDLGLIAPVCLFLCKNEKGDSIRARYFLILLFVLASVLLRLSANLQLSLVLFLLTLLLFLPREKPLQVT